jgi:hypothetical protein
MSKDYRTQAAGRVAARRRPETGLDYLWKLDESLRYWYTAAETKAQVTLTLDVVFLAFFTGSILTKRDDVAKTVTAFGPETWVFLAGMAAGVVGSIFCAIGCLMARGVLPHRIRMALAEHKVDPRQGHTYKPEVARAFAHLAELKPEQFVKQMRGIGPQFVVQALATDHIAWSKNIRRKHRLVNLAFILTGVALCSFLCVGVSYLIRVALAA